MSSETYPFPFVGAGRTQPFEKSSLYVRFVEPPDDGLAARIARDRPAPFGIRRGDGDLWLNSDDTLHAGIVGAYRGRLDGDGFADAPAVRRFDEAVEAWLVAVHELAPIRFALRPLDAESDTPKFSAWHRWSVRQVPALLPLLDAVLSAGEETSDAEIARQIVTMAQMSRVKLPDPWRAWWDPGRQVVAHLTAGRLQDARQVLARYPGHRILSFHMHMLALMLTRDESGAWGRQLHAKWPQDVPCDRPLLEPQRWGTVRGPLRAALVELVVDLTRQAAPLMTEHSHLWDGLLPRLADIAVADDIIGPMTSAAFAEALAALHDQTQVNRLIHHLERESASNPMAAQKLAAIHAAIPDHDRVGRTRH